MCNLVGKSRGRSRALACISRRGICIAKNIILFGGILAHRPEGRGIRAIEKDYSVVCSCGFCAVGAVSVVNVCMCCGVGRRKGL